MAAQRAGCLRARGTVRELREGQFDVLVGVNLLREGLDLPEVSLVAILDADKEGFLRSETSLMQTIGRSARNVNAKVLLYADKVTDSMQRAIDEIRRRRTVQEAYNAAHGITPETIRKAIHQGIESEAAAHEQSFAAVGRGGDQQYITEEYLEELQAEMLVAAESLEFERAAALRDRIEQMRKQMGKSVDESQVEHAARGRRGNKFKRHTGPGGIPKPRNGVKSPATGHVLCLDRAATRCYDGRNAMRRSARVALLACPAVFFPYVVSVAEGPKPNLSF